MPQHQPFSLSLTNAPRLCALAPKLDTLVFTRRDPGVTRLQVRQTLNFGIILAAGFPEATYSVNGVTQSATIPALICTRPGWNCQQLNPGPCEKLFFIYDRTLLPQFAAFADVPATVLQPLPRSRAIHDILEELLRTARDYGAPGDADRLDLLCLRLLSEFLLAKQKVGAPASPDRKRIDEVALYIDLHYTEEIDIGALILRSGLPERTFNRRWRERHALSPQAYLIRKRIEAACRLLHETDYKIYQVAQQTGFDDPFYFSRLFRKHTGFAPLQYRRLHG